MKTKNLAALALCALAVSCSKEDKTTALLEAANNDTEKVSRLIKAGVDVNAKSAAGDTALMFAVRKNAADVIELLKSAGAEE